MLSKLLTFEDTISQGSKTVLELDSTDCFCMDRINNNKKRSFSKVCMCFPEEKNATM